MVRMILLAVKLTNAYDFINELRQTFGDSYSSVVDMGISSILLTTVSFDEGNISGENPDWNQV